jgi:formylglycine-generating enzyme required for sulfatase activity
MVQIPGGVFMMGSPPSEAGRFDEEVQHSVTVSSFYISPYEVTQKEYQEAMGTNPSYFKGDTLPVEGVSWFDAVEYCNKRSQRERLSPAYTISGSGDSRTVTWNRNANGYRLPTEAEWEYACRAGTTTAYNTGGSISQSQANYDGVDPLQNNTTHVGSYEANPWGLYDMHGNVWEWCWDWYDSYSTESQTDPDGPVTGTHRVLRGGSWYNYGKDLRSAYRGNSPPSYRNDNLGFRLVK